MDRRHISPLTAFATLILITSLASSCSAVFTPPTATPTPTLVPTSTPIPPTDTPSPTPTPTVTQTPEPPPAVLIGAGDISYCNGEGAAQTAALILRLFQQYPQAQVFTAGDNAQSRGEIEEYTECFQETWGQFKERIHPSPGNHDGPKAPYFDYFGAAAGKRGLGYYSYDLGSWHIVALNSNCGDCSEQSAQVKWLQEDLQKNTRRCTLLYWHHPTLNSGKEQPSDLARIFWRIANQYGAEIVVNGHDHHYERFAPLDPRGRVDLARGMRTFIAGTGGAGLFKLGAPLPVTEARENRTLGVLLFVLYPNGYQWEFVPVEGKTFSDVGSGSCH